MDEPNHPIEITNVPSSRSAGSEDDTARPPMENQEKDQTKNNQSQVQQETLKASTAETPPNNAIPRNTDSCPEWFINIFPGDKGAAGKEEAASDQPQRVEIPKLPDNKLSGDNNKNKECYSPLVVFIGPYYSDEKQTEHWKSVKEKMAFQFVAESGKDIKEFYPEVEKVAEKAKLFYDMRSVNISDEDFIKRMFIDGCFIAQFIYGITRNCHLEMSDQEVANVKRDLLLLENQLPYPILDSLMKFGYKKERKESFKKEWEKKFNKEKESEEKRESRFEEEWKNWFKEEREKMIDEFLDEFLPTPQEFFSKLDLLVLFCLPFILLCYCFCCCCFCSGGEPLPPSAPKKKKGNTEQWKHLLQILYDKFIPKEPDEESGGRERRGFHLYYSAKDLKKVGIHFRPSKTTALTDVKFRASIFTGTLQLPPIIVEKSTKSMLLNLEGYESYGVPKRKNWVSSYIVFMDSLINDAEDVKELRSKGIISNYFGSDADVAKMFNDMTSSLEPDTSAHNHVKIKINKHCESVSKKWVAEWVQHYFSSPWAFIALVGAVLTIFLTAVATYIAVWPIH